MKGKHLKLVCENCNAPLFELKIYDMKYKFSYQTQKCWKCAKKIYGGGIATLVVKCDIPYAAQKD